MNKLTKKAVASGLVATAVLFTAVGCLPTLESGEDIKYNEIVYKRSVIPSYNMVLLDDHAEYIGDFIQTYENGELPWEVYTLNDEANVLFSAHAIWVKPGFVFPTEYDGVYSKAEYVVSSGILDDYTEEVDPLTTFTKEVTLADFIVEEATVLTDVTTYGAIRVHHTNFADICMEYEVCESNDVYYLNVKENTIGDPVYYEIEEEYVALFTSKIDK